MVEDRQLSDPHLAPIECGSTISDLVALRPEGVPCGVFYDVVVTDVDPAGNVTDACSREPELGGDPVARVEGGVCGDLGDPFGELVEEGNMGDPGVGFCL